MTISRNLSILAEGVTTTGILNISNGGTGSTTASAALTALGGYSNTNPSGYTSNVGTVTSVAGLTLGTTGSDLNSTVSSSTTTPVITLNVPTASSANRGALSPTDWIAFNAKQAALISGSNIKTVSGATILGSGDLGIIAPAYGGTGVNNGSATLNMANSVFFNGPYLQSFTATANTALTLPTSGTVISTVTNMAANPVTGTPSSSTYLRGDGTWASVGSGMVYPGAGIPNSTGSAWGTSYGVSGTGSVALTSNPVFATNITVNSVPVGRGGGVNSNRNVVVGSAAINLDSINNTAVGKDTLRDSGLSGGGLDNDNSAFGYQSLVSLDAGAYNTAIGSVSGSYLNSGDYNTFVGYNANLSAFGATGVYNCVYIGANVVGTGSAGAYNNEIVIGANAVGGGDNTVTIGNSSTIATTLKGSLNVAGALQITGDATTNQNIATTQTTGALTIGGTGATGTITLGRSTVSQTINIGTGVTNSSSLKTINIGTNSATGSSTNIVIGPTAGSVTTTLNGSVSIPAGFTTAGFLTVSGQLNLYGSISGTQSLATNQLSASIILGGANATGGIILGRSTLSQTIDIASANVTSSNTTTVNIANAGSAVGSCAVNIATGTYGVSNILTLGNTASTININGDINAIPNNVTLGTAAGTLNLNTTGTGTNTTIGATGDGAVFTVNHSQTFIASGLINVGNSVSTNSINGLTINVGTSQTTGTVTIGGTSQTGTITLGNSTAGQTVTIAGGTTAASTTKTVNICSAGIASSTGIVNIGSAGAISTITVGRTTQAQTVNIATGATDSVSTKTVSIGTGGLTGSTTNITVGSAAGTSTTTHNGINNYPALTASQAVFTDASKNLVSAVLPTPANAPYTTLAYGAGTPTLVANNNYRISLTTSPYTLTINPPSGTPADGSMVRLWIINPTTGGAGTAVNITLNAGIKIPTSSSTTSPISLAVGIKMVLAIQYDATSNTWQLATMINGYSGY